MANQVHPSPSLPRVVSGPSLRSLAEAFVYLIQALSRLFAEHAVRLNLALVKDGSEAMTGPVVLATYTVATVPAAASYTRGLIYVSDETGGAVPAFSDGTNWRRVTDRTIVS